MFILNFIILSNNHPVLKWMDQSACRRPCGLQVTVIKKKTCTWTPKRIGCWKTIFPSTVSPLLLITALLSSPQLFCVMTRLADNHKATPLSPVQPWGWAGGWVDGRIEVGRCLRMYPCVHRKELGFGLRWWLGEVRIGGYWGGGWLVIVIEQIPGGKFLACFCSRISNQRPTAAPFLPGLGNPINCV